MQDTIPSSPPRVGDNVHVKATGVTGEVTEIIGEDEDRRYIVAIWPAPDSPPSTAQSVAHRFCTLDELAPVRRP